MSKTTNKFSPEVRERAVRQSLFMPALCAIQHTPWAKAKFDRLVQAGKPRKGALTAIMRKLIFLANALLREGRKWSAGLA